MMKRSVVLRYAKALFDIDVEKNSLEKRPHDFEFLLALFKDHPQLVKFFESPQISVEEKKTVLKAYLTDRSDSTFLHFLFYLMDQGRLRDLEPIASEYRWMRNESLGIEDATIITATPIDPKDEEKLGERLQNFYQRKMKIKKEIDPHMIGGAILIIANKMIDWSMTGRLKKMKEDLLAKE